MIFGKLIFVVFLFDLFHNSFAHCWIVSQKFSGLRILFFSAAAGALHQWFSTRGTFYRLGSFRLRIKRIALSLHQSDSKLNKLKDSINRCVFSTVSEYNKRLIQLPAIQLSGEYCIKYILKEIQAKPAIHYRFVENKHIFS